MKQPIDIDRCVVLRGGRHGAIVHTVPDDLLLGCARQTFDHHADAGTYARRLARRFGLPLFTGALANYVAAHFASREDAPHATLHRRCATSPERRR